MSRNPRDGAPTEAALDAHRRHVVDGEPIGRIAQSLSQSPERIRKQIARVESWMVAGFGDEIRGIRVRHTERLEAMYHKSIAGYERSCEDEVVNKRTLQGDGASNAAANEAGRTKSDNRKLRVETVTKGKAGDARFLAEARAALAEIRRISGIDARSAADSERDDDASANIKQAWKRASDEELRMLIEARRLFRRLVADIQRPQIAD